MTLRQTSAILLAAACICMAGCRPCGNRTQPADASNETILADASNETILGDASNLADADGTQTLAPDGNTRFTRDGVPVSREYGGIYNVYPETVPAAPAAPKGYEVVYLSHYGRHGSRYIHLEEQYEDIAEMFRKAAENGCLTDEGADVYERFNSIYPLLKGRFGELTPLGQQQHRQIAERMVSNYPSLFRKGSHIQVRTTNLERTMLSMNAALNKIKEMKPGVEFEVDGSRTEMNYLNPQSTDNPLCTPEDNIWRSSKGEWCDELYGYARTRIDSRDFAARLFTDVDLAQSCHDLFDFEKKMFYFTLHLAGCPVGQVGFFDLFNDAELRELGRIEPAEFYYMKGSYPSEKARGDELDESLLNDFIVKTEQDLADGTTLRLRFGHDGCIAALFSLMGCEGWCQKVTDIAEIWTLWSTEEIPMAANIQMVFYAPKGSRDPEKMLFRWLVNEKPMALPLDSDADGCYRWSDFRDTYRPLVDETHATLVARRLD